MICEEQSSYEQIVTGYLLGAAWLSSCDCVAIVKLWRLRGPGPIYTIYNLDNCAQSISINSISRDPVTRASLPPSHNSVDHLG